MHRRGARSVRRVTARRLLHPGAWWAWALGMGIAAMRTTNVVLLALLIAVAGFVVSARRQDAPWGRSFAAFLRIGVLVIAIRMVLALLVGQRIGDTVLVDVPYAALPSWTAGITVGGPVTVELLAEAFRQGMRLAALLACFGAANALCSPRRLLRVLPAVLYEIGVAVTVALSFAPQAVMAAARVRDARRLRGRPVNGIRAIRGWALPVLEGALDQSIALAASMDARGYGRRADLTPRTRRLTTWCTGGGMLAVCVGVYGLLDAGSIGGVALPLVGVGSLLLAAALVVAGRRVPRTRYRPDPFTVREWGVLASGVAVAVAFGWVAAHDPGALEPAVAPLAWPEVPIVALVGIGFGALPAWIAPLPPLLTDVRDEHVVAAHDAEPEPEPVPVADSSPSASPAAPAAANATAATRAATAAVATAVAHDNVEAGT